MAISRSMCTIPLLCSKNFNTIQTTIRIEPTIQSIFGCSFSEVKNLTCRDLSDSTALRFRKLNRSQSGPRRIAGNEKYA